MSKGDCAPVICFGRTGSSGRGEKKQAGKRMVMTGGIRSFGKRDTFKCRRRVTKKYCKRVRWVYDRTQSESTVYKKRGGESRQLVSTGQRKRSQKTCHCFSKCWRSLLWQFPKCFLSRSPYKEMVSSKGEEKLSPWLSMVTGVCFQINDLL